VTRLKTLAELDAEARQPTSNGVLVGLDLGQSADFTALAIAEEWSPSGGRPSARSYHVGHLERFPLGTSYPGVVERVREVMRRPELVRRYPKRWQGNVPPDEPGRALPMTIIRPQLVVDATGVGRPVVDLLRAAGLAPIAVTITGGSDTTFVRGAGGVSWRVPKRDLVGALQVLLQTGRLKIAAQLIHASVLVDELLKFRVRISSSGHDSYGAATSADDWREGPHDDLVLALACATWWGLRRPPAHNGAASFPVIRV
jgi:hypothetical protein